MTIKEIIQQLSDLDEDLTVVVNEAVYDECNDIEMILVDADLVHMRDDDTVHICGRDTY